MIFSNYIERLVDRFINTYSPGGFEASPCLWSQEPAYVPVTDRDPAVRNTLATIASERTGREAEIIFGLDK